jgi:hypothetical protein
MFLPVGKIYFTDGGSFADCALGRFVFLPDLTTYVSSAWCLSSH